ncbi:Flp family type IVb pilin [Acidicapsa dinghuensis]|uniref:Flp family type IVb pilin n=1 Tax=Acidicapsa dinghuensis TaxID=2218256 RepID=A0ABW1EIJ1_9BACT|nr:Flp family type IVb pilin [Acidicapsa dinghuensis]
MNNLMNKLNISFRNLIECEEGQDLVEYALVVALIALGAIAGMNGLASDINTFFGNIGTSLMAQ